LNPVILRARPTLLKIHRWVGVCLGFMIILQGLTGSVTAFRHELNRLVHASALVVAPNRPAAPVQAVIKSLKAAVPGARLTRLDYPTRPDEAYFARLEGKGGVVLATVDPSTAQVLRQGGFWAWPVELIYQLHYTLVAGEIGERVVGLTGLAILFMAVTGPLVWWPGTRGLKRAFKVETGVNAYRTTRDLHRLLGICIALVLGVIAFTGINMAWRPWLQPLVSAVAPMHPGPKVKPPKGDCRKPLPLDQVVAAAQARESGEAVRSLRYQGKTSRTLNVLLHARLTRPRATDQVMVDTCTAQVLSVREAAKASGGDAFYDWLLPIHSGEWLNTPGRVLDELAALSLIGLGGTGYWLWATRSAKMHRTRKARG